MKTTLYVAVAALLTASMAPTTTADTSHTILVEPGETLVLSGTVNADAVTVHGTILALGDLTLSADTIQLAETARILGADGVRGTPAVADSATAEDGGHGASLTLTARIVTIEDGAHVQSGSGGAGGNALGKSLAVGGSGGAGGDIHLHAAEARIDAVLLPGAGGDGGHAHATGTSEAGPAHGGDGGASGMVYLNGQPLLQAIPDVLAPESSDNDSSSIRKSVEKQLGIDLNSIVRLIANTQIPSVFDLLGTDPGELVPEHLEQLIPDDPVGDVTGFVGDARDGGAGNVVNVINDLATSNPNCINANGRDGADNMLGDGGDGGHGCTEVQKDDGADGANGRDDPTSCGAGGHGGQGTGASAGAATGGIGGSGTRNGGDGGSATSQAYAGRGGNGGNGGQAHFSGYTCAGGNGGSGGNAVSGAVTPGGGGDGLCGSGGQGGTGSSIPSPGAGGAGGSGQPAGLPGTAGQGTAGAGNGGRGAIGSGPGTC